MAKVITSTFKADADGWSMQGDVASSGWQSGGGHPGGYFFWVDAASGSDSYYIAPDKFLGDKHKFFGGSFSYDIENSSAGYSGVPDVQIAGANGVTLVAVLGQPGTDWTHFSITLSASAGWHIGTLDGAVATKADIKGVLADVSQLLIRAEYESGAEQGGIDNVVLSRPAPAAAPHAFADAGHPLDLAVMPPMPSHLDHAHLAIA